MESRSDVARYSLTHTYNGRTVGNTCAHTTKRLASTLIEVESTFVLVFRRVKPPPFPTLLHRAFLCPLSRSASTNRKREKREVPGPRRRAFRRKQRWAQGKRFTIEFSYVKGLHEFCLSLNHRETTRRMNMVATRITCHSCDHSSLTIYLWINFERFTLLFALGV